VVGVAYESKDTVLFINKIRFRDKVFRSCFWYPLKTKMVCWNCERKILPMDIKVSTVELI